MPTNNKAYSPLEISVTSIFAGIVIVASFQGAISEPEKTVRLWVDGACKKEFKAEAAVRGFKDFKENTLALSADRRQGLCKASFENDRGYNTSFDWLSNQGGHTPRPLSEQTKPMGAPPPSASAPASAP